MVGGLPLDTITRPTRWQAWVTPMMPPPARTKAGTVCWLYCDDENGRHWCAVEWLGASLDTWLAPLPYGANRVARAGWRFHSVAEVPNV